MLAILATWEQERQREGIAKARWHGSGQADRNCTRARAYN